MPRRGHRGRWVWSKGQVRRRTSGPPPVRFSAREPPRQRTSEGEARRRPRRRCRSTTPARRSRTATHGGRGAPTETRAGRGGDSPRTGGLEPEARALLLGLLRGYRIFFVERVGALGRFGGAKPGRRFGGDSLLPLFCVGLVFVVAARVVELEEDAEQRGDGGQRHEREAGRAPC